DAADVFNKAPAAAKGTPSSECILRVQLKGVVREVRFIYTDQHCSDGVVLRRGIGQLVASGGKPVLDPNRYEELLDRLPIGVVIHRGGSVLFANKHAHTLTGASGPRELVGLNALDFVDPNYHLGINERIKQ